MLADEQMVSAQNHWCLSPWDEGLCGILRAYGQGCHSDRSPTPPQGVAILTVVLGIVKSFVFVFNATPGGRVGC